MRGEGGALCMMKSKKLLKQLNGWTMSHLEKFLYRRWFCNVILLIWIISMAFVSYLSLVPRVEFPLEFWSADLLYHALAYAWLSVLPFFVFMRVRTAQAGALMMILLGTGLEFLQMFMPGRFFSLADMIANCFGAVSGLFVGRHLKSYLETVLESLSL
jgi:hypothetical protein